MKGIKQTHKINKTKRSKKKKPKIKQKETKYSPKIAIENYK